jgi:hypothetical protein
MKSPGGQASFRRAELAERLASVMQASRAIRSEAALAICESTEMRIASRQLRMESYRTSQKSAAWRQGQHPPQKPEPRQIARTIAQMLSARGYLAFVAAPSQDTASIQ